MRWLNGLDMKGSMGRMIGGIGCIRETGSAFGFRCSMPTAWTSWIWCARQFSFLV